MKTKLFKITITAELDKDVDLTTLGDRFTEGLKSSNIPQGQVRVMIQPIVPVAPAPITFSSLN